MVSWYLSFDCIAITITGDFVVSYAWKRTGLMDRFISYLNPALPPILIERLSTYDPQLNYFIYSLPFFFFWYFKACWLPLLADDLPKRYMSKPIHVFHWLARSVLSCPPVSWLLCYFMYINIYPLLIDAIFLQINVKQRSSWDKRESFKILIWFWKKQRFSCGCLFWNSIHSPCLHFRWICNGRFVISPRGLPQL